MQSISIYKPENSKEYTEDELKKITNTRIELVNGEEEDLTFQMFFNEQIGDYRSCHIRMDEPFSIEGRVFNRDITEIIITETYDAFLNTKTGILFVLANKDSADLIHQQFNKEFRESYKRLIFNLQDIITNSTNVKRTQFRKLTIETIQGSSLSGNRVTDTEMYRTMLDAGELSTIAVNYPSKGEDLSFSISDSGTIVMFSNLTAEETLDFLDSLISELLTENIQ